MKKTVNFLISEINADRMTLYEAAEKALEWELTYGMKYFDPDTKEESRIFYLMQSIWQKLMDEQMAKLPIEKPKKIEMTNC